MTFNPHSNRIAALETIDYGFVTSFPDVTSKNQLKAKIEEQQALLKEAESLAQMGSWKWTKCNDQLHWSDGLYKIMGKRADQSISWDTFLENIFPEDVRLMSDYLYDVKANKRGSVISYRTKQNGCIRYFSLTTKPHTILDGEILGAVVDITEHRENQQRLQESNLIQARVIRKLDEKEKRYRTLFERSVDPIFLTTGKLIFISVNHSFFDFTGYTAIEGSSFSLQNIFFNTKDYQHFEAKLKADGQVRDFEVPLLTRFGEKKYCLLNCIFISDPVEANCCYQGIIHDLTLRKQAENEMLIAERLSLTGKIARTIAHEVRNPLTNINLALDQLRSEFPVENNSAMLYSDIIERNAGRIEELMGEMLNTSKPKKLNLALISIQTVLLDTIKMAQDRINLNQIQLILKSEHHLPRLLADQGKMEIAFLNIIMNAIEAMTPGAGVLTIHTAHKDDLITVSISDNGKGIATEDIKRLFDPFFTGKQNGMGLGLTSTKNILNSHNAQIEVKSEVGRGTCFSILFKLPE